MNISNITAVGCLTRYESKVTQSGKSFNTQENEKVNENKRLLGIGFLSSPNSNDKYGMRAEYAENYSNDNPVVKVTVQKGNDITEEYNININEIDPASATEIEMFALCNYADANGMGIGGTFGSWQTLKYYQRNAADNGYFKMSDSMDNFRSLKQNWVAMVNRMMTDYMNSGLYKQGMDGKKLLSMFDKADSILISQRDNGRIKNKGE